jgi:hypothetical protein
MGRGNRAHAISTASGVLSLFWLQGTGTAGLTYTLQTSTNLVDWVDQTNVEAGPGGLIKCLVDMDPDAPACFYRLRWP